MRTNSVIVLQGFVFEDGDYYVVELNPAQPGSLLKLRKSDVTNLENIESTETAEGSRQHHLISVKRGVPVMRITIDSADRLFETVASGIGVTHTLYSVSGVRCANGGLGTRQEYRPGVKIDNYSFGESQPPSANIIIQSHKKINDFTIEFWHDAIGICGSSYIGYVPIIING